MPIWLMLVPMKNHVSFAPSLMSYAPTSSRFFTGDSATMRNQDFPAKSIASPRDMAPLSPTSATVSQSPSTPFVEFADVITLKFWRLADASTECWQLAAWTYFSPAQDSSPRVSHVMNSFVGPSPTFSAKSDTDETWLKSSFPSV